MPPKSEPAIIPVPNYDLEQPHANSFLASIKRDHAPSLLFSGPEGSGKELTAINFARRLLCENDTVCDPANDVCGACYQTLLLENPGMHLIYPTPTQGSGEGDDGDVMDIAKVLEDKRLDIFSRYRFSKKASLRIARSRAVIQRANIKPFEARLHVFIFVDAHAMREEAQNALLKLVEEPPPHSVIIFITTNPEGVLYTIRSRCQRVRFMPLKPSVLEHIMSDYYGASASDARRASVLAQGSIDRARLLVEASDAEDRSAAAAFVGEMKSGSASWAIGQALLVARSGNREGVARFLDEISVVFRDVMVEDPALIVNSEMVDQISEMVGTWPRQTIPRIVERIARSRGEILINNANIESALTSLFLDIRRMTPR